jgi:hypothetical protein
MAETVFEAQIVLDKLEFYYRNFIDCELDGFAFTGDFAEEENVADRDGDTVALTSGKNDDDLTATFEVAFGQARTIDTIFLESNAKHLRIQYSTTISGENFQEFAPAIWYQVSETFLKLEFSAVASRRVRLTITGTQTVDAEKQITQFIITKKITTMSLPEGTELISKAKGTSIETIDGGTVIVFDFPTMDKMEMNLSLKNWCGADYTAYAFLKQRRKIDAYLVYAYLSTTISHLGANALYLMSDISDDANTPSASNFEAGIEGEIQLREA